MNTVRNVRFAAAAAVLALALPARAELPAGPFPGCAEDAPQLCPNDLGNDWELISWLPPEVFVHDAQEQVIGSGVGVDVAWGITAGRTDVTIAVLDSGIKWDEGSVRRKVALNRDELPEPAIGEGPGIRGRWDIDGDGVLTVDDYAWDLRVVMTDGVDAADHLLDASDLIAAFSDGIDADRNGFVDDIAGWDFHWNDNDPYDDTRFGHGTSEAKLSCAEGNDGGPVGSCPNCMFLPVRVGDAFIADADNIAAAILFAADSDAKVVQGALGALGNNPHLRSAMRWAHESGAVLVFAAGDETSWHHNFPATNPEALYVSANRYDGDEIADSTTFLNNSNCTNHGPRMDLTVPSDGCASGAVGRAAGVAGLIWSAAMDAGLDPPLTPDEVKQLLITTVDDVDVPGSRGDDADPGKYPSYPGWDAYFGYGRVSAARAVTDAAEGRIPPVAVFDAPRWYAVHERGEVVQIEGSVSAIRDDVASWSLEWAPGGDPRDSSFIEFAVGTEPIDGLLGSITTSDLIAGGVEPSSPADDRDLFENNVSRMRSAHRDAFTLRLVVTDTRGQTGVARRMAFLQDDPDLLAGYPLELEASIEASPRIADLDGDGREELILATTAGAVHVRDGATGISRSGWPVWTPVIEEVDAAGETHHLDSDGVAQLEDLPHQGVIATPSLADLDGDGVLDIVVATLRGQLLVYSGADGSVLPGFPVSVDPANSDQTSPQIKVERGFLGSPAIEDLDGDGSWEIIASAMDGYVYVWRSDGTEQPGWPVPVVSIWGAEPANRVVSSPAIGDVDGDGVLDVVVGSNEALTSQYALLYAIKGTGIGADGAAYLDNFPIAVFAGYTEVLPVVGEGMPTSPSLADVDGDGTLEIGANAIADPGVIWSWTGEPFVSLAATREAFGGGHNSKEDALLQMMNNGAWGDIDLDGVPEFINGAAGINFATGFLEDGVRSEFDHLVGAWDPLTGDFEFGFPQVIEDLQFFMNPAVADVSGDALPEVISASGGYLVHAWDVTGVEAPGFPKSTGGWVVASPAVGDIDRDGFRDVVVASRDGYVFAWKTRGAAWGPVEWATFHHDNRGTGNLHTPLRQVLPPEIQAGGCSCSLGRLGWETGKLGNQESGLLLFVLALFACRRRR